MSQFGRPSTTSELSSASLDSSTRQWSATLVTRHEESVDVSPLCSVNANWVRLTHSERSAVNGSTRAARRAGINDAAMPPNAMKATVAAMLAGSSVGT